MAAVTLTVDEDCGADADAGQLIVTGSLDTSDSAIAIYPTKPSLGTLRDICIAAILVPTTASSEGLQIKVDRSPLVCKCSHLFTFVILFTDCVGHGGSVSLAGSLDAGSADISFYQGEFYSVPTLYRTTDKQSFVEL